MFLLQYGVKVPKRKWYNTCKMKEPGVQRLKKDYPWIKTPLVVGAPMRLIALADMAVEISKAGTLRTYIPCFLPVSVETRIT